MATEPCQTAMSRVKCLDRVCTFVTQNPGAVKVYISVKSFCKDPHSYFALNPQLTYSENVFIAVVTGGGVMLQ